MQIYEHTVKDMKEIEDFEQFAIEIENKSRGWGAAIINLPSNGWSYEDFDTFIIPQKTNARLERYEKISQGIFRQLTKNKHIGGKSMEELRSLLSTSNREVKGTFYFDFIAYLFIFRPFTT